MSSVIRGSDDFTTSLRPGMLNIVSTHYTEPTSQSMVAYIQSPIANLEAVITPSSVNSKILVIAQWCGEINAGGEENNHFGLSRNGIAIGQEGSSAGIRRTGIMAGAVCYHNDDNSTLESVRFHYLDSPGIKLELTYQILASISSTTTLFTNRTKGDTDSHNYERGTSGITLIEII